MSVGGVDLDQRTDQTQESLMFGISGSPAQKRADLIWLGRPPDGAFGSCLTNTSPVARLDRETTCPRWGCYRAPLSRLPYVRSR
jgi:hypothetical protein